jgi:hypothetical protein
MKTWSTIIYAKCAATGEMKQFGGQNIKAPTRQLAHEYCQTHGLGYCHIGDEVVMEIPCKKNSYEPDFDNAEDFDLENLN